VSFSIQDGNPKLYSYVESLWRIYIAGQSSKCNAEFGLTDNLTTKGLMRFVPRDGASRVLIGEPEDQAVDVGAALYRKQDVWARVWSGGSVLQPGSATKRRILVDRMLSPLNRDEVGTVRCIGLNVGDYACWALIHPFTPAQLYTLALRKGRRPYGGCIGITSSLC
jgi:hypothetical protein